MKTIFKIFLLTALLLRVSLVNAQCPVVAPVPNNACYQQVILNDTYCCNTAWDAICQGAYDACNVAPPCPVVAPVPNNACYQQVITNDTYCCNTAWDAICQGAYDACNVPPPCPVVAPVPNNACYQQVITNDPYCCNTAWDAICQGAYDACIGGGGGTGPCASITPLIGCGTSTGANLSGPGTWDMGTCGFSTPGTEMIFSFTATATGVHTLNITSVSGGYLDFMWVPSTSGCSTTAGWNCISDVGFTGTYGSMLWTAGVTYYILIDSETTGATSVTFNVDCPNPGTPAVAGDCAVAIPVCTNLAFAVDPSGFGATNELCTYCVANPSTNPAGVNSGCLLSGELNSTWFTVNVAAGGTLEFSFGSPGGGNCYDWIMWSYNPSTCANIINNTQPPVTCNWNVPCNSFTGMASTPPVGGSTGNFQPTMNVNTGDQYLICFSNYSSALTTVPLDFFGTSDISCTLLPVEFLSFEGEANSNFNTLTWVTGAEINSSHFVVERSKDGLVFDAFSQTAGAGMDLNGNTYSTKDFKPFSGLTYYRLKQVDIDGKFRYSNVISVSNTQETSFEIIAGFPNPTSDEFNVQVFSPGTGRVAYQISDVRGTVLLRDSYVSTGGVNTITLPVHLLGKGVYIVRATSESTGESDVIRFTVE